MKPSQTVAIIGGGFSGINVAAQLALQSSENLTVVLFNFKYPFAKGVAYHMQDEEHLLNVPASAMSFFHDKPAHFVEWLQLHYPDSYVSVDKSHVHSFVPRNIYGHYITDCFNRSLLHSKVYFRLIEEEVTDMEANDGAYLIFTSGNFVQRCDKVILALGNNEPEIPAFITRDMIDKGIYVNNPWLKEAVHLEDKHTDILLLGSGLTMVDNLLSLKGNGFSGNAYVVSTKGYSPVAFHSNYADPVLLSNLQPPYDLHNVFGIFRKHLLRVHAEGVSAAALVSALRPVTQKIWMELPHHERLRFLAHVRHLWGVARHRVPAQSYQSFTNLVETGRVKQIAGRLVDLQLYNGIPHAVVQERKSASRVFIPVQRIINCTGPLSNITHTTSLLLRNAFKKKLLEPDPLHLGLNATANGAVLQSGIPSKNLFTLGPMLKGIVWETTAVNEIRQQAHQIASMISSQVS